MGRRGSSRQPEAVMGFFGHAVRALIAFSSLFALLISYRVALVLVHKPPVDESALSDAPLTLPADAQFQRLAASGGVQLNAITCGADNSQLLILLHGFPETALVGWHHQLPSLCPRFRVIAPDMRGYNTSDKPSGIAAYDQALLSDDVAALIRGAGHQQAFVVGHDWGAAVAWIFASRYPEMVKKLGILNVPHPFAMREYLYSHWSQVKKSWYIFFFQFPFLPEIRLTLDNWAWFRSIFSQPRGLYSRAELAARLQGWSEPGCATAMVNYYRALFTVKRLTTPPPSNLIQPETLIIWGKKDFALEWQMAESSLSFCRSARVEFIEDSGHFVQHEAAERVTQLLLDYLGSA